jgi:hypothetical protein
VYRLTSQRFDAARLVEFNRSFAYSRPFLRVSRRDFNDLREAMWHENIQVLREITSVYRTEAHWQGIADLDDSWNRSGFFLVFSVLRNN